MLTLWLEKVQSGRHKAESVMAKKASNWTVFHPATQKPISMLLLVPKGKDREYVQAVANKAYLLTGKVNGETVQRMLDIETLK